MRLFSTLLFCCLPVVCGCGGGTSDQPPLAEVSGQVTLDGKPLPNVTLTFTPVESGRPSSAVSDDSGNFTLEYTANASGAMIGKHKVMVAVIEEDDVEVSVGSEAAVTLPAAASDGSMVKEVKEGSNTIDIAL